MNNSGKHLKAIKLFQHAMALSPEHPDILNHYGEFLEEVERKLVEADYHYSRALAFSPQHSRATQNRQRTTASQQNRQQFSDENRPEAGQPPEHTRLQLRAEENQKGGILPIHLPFTGN